MKKNPAARATRFALSCCLLAIVVSFTSCTWMFASNGGTEHITEDPNNIVDDSETLSPRGYVRKVLPGETTVTLRNVLGKTLLFANINTSKYNLGELGNQSRAIIDAAGVKTSNDMVCFSTDSLASNHSLLKTDTGLDLSAETLAPVRYWHDTYSEQLLRNLGKASRSGSARLLDQDFGGSVSATYTAIDVGTRTKEIFIDTAMLEGYSQTNVKLRAIGTYGGKTICYVWVPEIYFTEGTSQGNKVNGALAQDIADRFAKHYAHERSIFGNESDYLLNDSTGEPKSITSYKKNDTAVNIVIYDIGKDFESKTIDSHITNGSSEEVGVIGYFASKDYLDNADGQNKYTNFGKYIYIDSAFCNYTGGKAYPTYDGGSKVSETAISTLFHEFQHMIHFNQKIIKPIQSGTMPNMEEYTNASWYNEMLSMLCEDMMQEQLNLSDGESPKARLPAFQFLYCQLGLQYEPTDSANYSIIYAFGAWLAREYGGPEFVRAMSQNSHFGMDSIILAIKSFAGKTETVDSLVKKWAEACAFRDNFAKANNLPTYNKNADGTITAEGQTSRMDAFSLFAQDWSCTNMYSYLQSRYFNNMNFNGPMLFPRNVVLGLCPYSFSLHYIGEATQNEVTLRFSPSYTTNDQVYIYVQDKFNNKL